MGEVKLACPECKNTDSLSTIEELIGVADVIGMERDAQGEIFIHWGTGTRVDWDNSQTVGVQCDNCGWAYEGSDWSGQLLPPPA